MGDRPRVLSVKQAIYSRLLECPKCNASVLGTYCGKCNMYVRKVNGLDVGTDINVVPTFREIKDYLHPAPKTIISIPKEAVEYAKAQIKEPKSHRKPMVSRYEPRSLTHEKPKKRWAWRSFYAIITLVAAALTLWRFLGSCI